MVVVKSGGQGRLSPLSSYSIIAGPITSSLSVPPAVTLYSCPQVTLSVTVAILLLFIWALPTCMYMTMHTHVHNRHNAECYVRYV